MARDEMFFVKVYPGILRHRQVYLDVIESTRARAFLTTQCYIEYELRDKPKLTEFIGRMRGLGCIVEPDSQDPATLRALLSDVTEKLDRLTNPDRF
jgi:hypothetical protein